MYAIQCKLQKKKKKENLNWDFSRFAVPNHRHGVPCSCCRLTLFFYSRFHFLRIEMVLDRATDVCYMDSHLKHFNNNAVFSETSNVIHSKWKCYSTKKKHNNNSRGCFFLLFHFFAKQTTTWSASMYTNGMWISCVKLSTGYYFLCFLFFLIFSRLSNWMQRYWSMLQHVMYTTVKC